MTSKVAKNNKTNYLHFTNLNVSRPMRLVALLLFLISCICFSLFVILSTWWLPKINHICFWTLSLQIVLFFFRINKTDNYGFKMIHNAILDPVIITGACWAALEFSTQCCVNVLYTILNCWRTKIHQAKVRIPVECSVLFMKPKIS